MKGGVSVARRETNATLVMALDLHARHHFTHAAAVDGSLTEELLTGGGVRRRLAYGVWEGAKGEAWGSGAVAAGLWGKSMTPDCEVVDAELAAIHAYLRAVVERLEARSEDPSHARVLVLSDCMGALDSLEGAWREGDARGLRTRDRGALLESCCVLRAQLERVVFMYVPAHRGSAPNAYADAAAKAHLGAGREDTMMDLRARVMTRPILCTRLRLTLAPMASCGRSAHTRRGDG